MSRLSHGPPPLIMRMTMAVLASLLPVSAVDAESPHLNGTYVATAYSVTGITASGEWTHRHVIAADPDILPIGSRVHIRRAGKYSGEYVVADTGAKIQGRKIDIYMPSTAECVKFGSRRIRIKVIELGDGTREATRQADHAVKADVAKDVAKGTVGNAATDLDWKKGVTGAKTADPNAASPVPAKTDPAKSKTATPTTADPK
jgi:3D (Asp-Asp-Asp) domain-containing protein